MTLLLVVLGLVCAWAAHVTCNEIIYEGSSSQDGGLGMYMGNATTIDKHPYLVAVTYKGKFVCAATIIADSWVLSLAFVAKSFVTKDLGVIAGSQNGVSGTNYEVVQGVAHPSYKPPFDYNYALLQIKGRFDWSSKVKKVTLPSSEAKVGSEVFIAGWGKQSKSNSQLQEGKMRVISLETCKKLYAGFSITLTERMGCIYNKGKTTPCVGDGGDPATQGGVLQYFFIAIALQGFCSSDAFPAICSSVYPVVPWIKNVTNIE